MRNCVFFVIVILFMSLSQVQAFDFALARYKSNGKLDGKFGKKGKVLTDFGRGTKSQDVANDVAVQPDGKIVAVGYSDANGSFDFALARYSPDGSLDTSFGEQGMVLTNFGSGNADFAFSIAIQSDGKILVGGTSAPTGNQSGTVDFAVVRYNSDGSVDQTFGRNGMTTTDFAKRGDNGRSVAIDSEGRVVFAGFSGKKAVDLNTQDFAVLRLNSDGSIDKKFSRDGKILTSFGNGRRDQAFAIAVQPDGKVIVGGLSAIDTNEVGSFDFALTRLNNDGTVDKTFNSDGKVLVGFGNTTSDQISALAIQPDGKIITMGSTISPPANNNWVLSRFAIVRFTADGELDTGFGGTGRVQTEFNRSNRESANSVMIQSDGKIVAVGSVRKEIPSPGRNDFGVVRFHLDGQLDQTFSKDGKVLTDFGGKSDDQAFAVAQQPDGKIIVAGYSAE